MKEFTYHLIIALSFVLFSTNIFAQGADEAHNATTLCADNVIRTATISSTNTNRTQGGIYPNPSSCTGGSSNGFYKSIPQTPSAGGDIWYKIFVEQTLTSNNPLVINTTAGTLNTVSMAVYKTTTPNLPASFIQVACSDNQSSATGNYMPRITLNNGLTTPAGTWVYVRLWEENQDALGDFQILAYYGARLATSFGSAVSGKTIYVCEECMASFLDSGGDNALTGNYQSNENQTVTYCGEQGKAISMEYQSVGATYPGGQIKQQLLLQSQKTGNDYLYIYDGNSVAANQIGTYTGADATYPQPGTIVSSGNCLTVNFKSNFDSVLTSTGTAKPNAMGWKAFVKGTTTSVVNPAQYVNFADIKPFRSTNYPANYNNNENTVSTFCPSTNDQGVWAVFSTDISLETNKDYLYVYDGANTNAAVLNVYTGGFTQSGNNFTATNYNRLGMIKATETNISGCLTFKFVSNGTTTFGGWNAQITTGPKRYQGMALGEDCSSAINIPYVSGTRTYAGRNFNATANPAGGTFGANASGTNTTGIGTDDPQLDIVGCVGGNITRLESSIWYKFVAPNSICAGDILVKLENVSNQNHNGLDAGVQVAIYQTNGSCLMGAGWQSSLSTIGAIKKYCQDKVTSQTPSINLRPFIQPNQTYYILIDGFNGQHTNFDIVVKIGGDTDNDGVCDSDDIDDDNDGIVDVIESGCNPGQVFGIGCLAINPSEDSDSDGILNYMDNTNNDLNNNGVANETLAEILGATYAPNRCGGLNSKGICNVVADFDMDGTPNFLELDSDGDGLLDLREAGGTDSNGDGMVDCLLTGLNICDNDGDGLQDLYDYIDDDMDNNGYPDYYNVGTTRTSIPLPNTDYLGEANFLDIDSDDDGITDNIEGQATLGFVAITGFDDDRDGIDNGYDNYVGFGGVGAGDFGQRQLPPYGTSISIMNSDGLDLPDYLDVDSDNDGFSDLLEGHDYNHNGTIADDGVGNWLNGNDFDNDGLLNAFDNLTSSRSVWSVGNGTGNCPGTSGLCIRQASTSIPEWTMSNPPDDDNEPDFRDRLIILPASYLVFTGEWSRTDANLDWQMITDGFDYFELQRSVDGENFTTISKQDEHATGIYNYKDVGALALSPDYVYYRLRMVDFDGQSVKSEIIRLSTQIIDETAKYAVVSPNPASNALKLECFNMETAKIKIKIFDVQGKLVYDETVRPASESYYQTILDVSGLEDGMYEYMLIGQEEPLTGKFVIAKWSGD